MKKILRIILWVFVGLLIIAQFFPIDKTNPESDPAKDFLTMVSAPDDIAYIIKTTCYDCHSNETKFPWYTNVAPVSWWVKDHIDHGREELNFSLWGDFPKRRQAHKMEECYEEVEERLMPLKSYTWAHSEARLTPEQRELLVNWFKEQESNMK